MDARSPSQQSQPLPSQPGVLPQHAALPPPAPPPKTEAELRAAKAEYDLMQHARARRKSGPEAEEAIERDLRQLQRDMQREL